MSGGEMSMISSKLLGVMERRFLSMTASEPEPARESLFTNRLRSQDLAPKILTCYCLSARSYTPPKLSVSLKAVPDVAQ